MSTQVEELIKWASDNGAYIDSSIKWENSEEKGVHAIYNSDKPHRADSQLLKVPESLTITPDLAVKVFGDIAKKGRNRNPLTQILLAKLKFDTTSTFVDDVDLTAFFKPYIQTLPTGREIGSPLFWDGDERSLLKGTDAFLSVDRQTKCLLEEWYTIVTSLKSEHVPSSFKEDISFYETLKNGKSEHFASYLNSPMSWTSFPAYLWAHATFTSRAFPYFLGTKTARDMNEAFLLPIFDLLNHDNDTEVKWDALNSDDAKLIYTFKTQQILSKDCEIFNSYGPKTNEELLFGYGFALASNRHESAILALRIPEDQVEGAIKFGVKMKTSEVSFTITKDDLLPENLTRLFAYLVKVDSETGVYLRNQLEGLKQIARILTGKIDTLKEVKSSGTIDPKIVKASKIYRTSQKQLFQLAFEDITRTEKALLKKYKPLSFKTVFKTDKAFADSLLLIFGIRDYEILAKSDEVDRALLLWVIRVGNKKYFKEKSLLPDWLNQRYQTILSKLVVREDDVRSFKPIYQSLFPSIAQKIPEVYAKGDWSIKSFIAAQRLIDQISFTREANNEVFLIEHIKL